MEEDLFKNVKNRFLSELVDEFEYENFAECKNILQNYNVCSVLKKQEVSKDLFKTEDDFNNFLEIIKHVINSQDPEKFRKNSEGYIIIGISEDIKKVRAKKFGKDYLIVFPSNEK